MPIPDLNPLITRSEVDLAMKNGEYHGRSVHLKQLLSTLLSLKTFNASTRSSLERCMYAIDPESDDYGKDRLERFTRELASPITREAQYFLDGFAHVFSQEWAAEISLDDLVNEPLGKLIKRLQSKLPMEFFDPLKLAFLLNSQNSDNEFRFEMVPDSLRWGEHNSTVKPPELANDIPTLQIGGLFSLSLKGSHLHEPLLILQIADEPILIDGKVTRAQAINQTTLLADELQIRGINGTLIKASPVVGRFHYLALPRVDLHDSLPPFLDERELQSVLTDAWNLSLENNSNRSAIVTYRVEK